MHSANREIQALKQKYIHTDKHMDTQTRTQTYKRTEALIIHRPHRTKEKRKRPTSRQSHSWAATASSIPSNFNFKSVLTTTARNTSALL